jgi:hypothetical protein
MGKGVRKKLPNCLGDFNLIFVLQYQLDIVLINYLQNVYGTYLSHFLYLEFFIDMVYIIDKYHIYTAF